VKKAQKEFFVAKIDGRTVDCIEAPDLEHATKKLEKRWTRTVQGHADKHQRDVTFAVQLLQHPFPTLHDAGFAKYFQMPK
jgi:hypothetical protein